jgi:hypothetical protein
MKHFSFPQSLSALILIATFSTLIGCGGNHRFQTQ